MSGIVHLWADNNHDYNNVVYGPLIAAFHLHHKQPKYKNKNIVHMYFSENGSKIWLLICILAYILCGNSLHKYVKIFLINFFLLSSFAEVSHYLCHNSTNKFVKYLQKYNIILRPVRHQLHHEEDNKNYTFLNGCTDFIVNYIAKQYYKGYKSHADIHSLDYTGQTANRI
jgi:hypothetical protein